MVLCGLRECTDGKGSVLPRELKRAKFIIPDLTCCSRPTQATHLFLSPSNEATVKELIVDVHSCKTSASVITLETKKCCHTLPVSSAYRGTELEPFAITYSVGTPNVLRKVDALHTSEQVSVMEALTVF